MKRRKEEFILKGNGNGITNKNYCLARVKAFLILGNGESEKTKRLRRRKWENEWKWINERCEGFKTNVFILCKKKKCESTFQEQTLNLHCHFNWNQNRTTCDAQIELIWHKDVTLAFDLNSFSNVKEKSILSQFKSLCLRTSFGKTAPCRYARAHWTVLAINDNEWVATKRLFWPSLTRSISAMNDRNCVN